MRIVFEKRAGKYDAMLVERESGAVEEIACPRQPPIPHDMFHFAVETVLQRRGFLHRAAAGEGAGFRMAAEPLSDAIERLVETMQADSWSGRPDVSEAIAMFAHAVPDAEALGLTLSPEDVMALRREIDRLAAAWAATPERGRLVLEL